MTQHIRPSISNRFATDSKMPTQQRIWPSRILQIGLDQISSIHPSHVRLRAFLTRRVQLRSILTRRVQLRSILTRLIRHCAINTGFVQLCVVAICLGLISPRSAQADGEHIPLEFQLKNGLRVLFLPIPDLPMIDLRLSFDAGSARDGERPGLARLTHRLLTEGAGPLDARELALAFDRHGALLKTGSARDMAWIDLRSLSAPAALEPSLNALRTLLHQPRFAPDSIEQQKQQALASIKSIAQSPSALADQLFYETLYENHPYGHPPVGTPISISQITAEEIKAFYAQHYVAKNAVMTLIGDLTEPQALALATRLAGDLPAGERAPALPTPRPLTESRTVYLPYPAAQTHIRMGSIARSADFPERHSLLVANYSLGGGGLRSRLGDVLREQRGLTYHISSQFQGMAAPGPFVISTEVNADHMMEAVGLIRSTLGSFFLHGPTAQEREDAIAALTGRFPLQIASNSALLNQIAFQGFYRLPSDSLSNYPNLIRQPSLAEIVGQFQQVVQPDRLITVIVGGAN